MRIAIIPTRNVVLVDGKPHDVDCSMLDQSIHAIEMGDKRGVIEYTNDRFVGPDHYRPNEVFTDFSQYQPLVDAWQAAEVTPPQPPQPLVHPDPPIIEPLPRPPIPPEIQAIIDNNKIYLADTDRKDMVNRMKGATPAQIKNYINTNVTDLASAKVVLMKLALILSLIIQGEPTE